jgi:hypothetical protein
MNFKNFIKFKKSETVDLIYWEFEKISKEHGPFEFLKRVQIGEYDYLANPENLFPIQEGNDHLKDFKTPNDDFETAKQLFEYMPGLRLEEANDKRLWTYLCLFPYRNYIIGRGSYDPTKIKKDTITKNIFYKTTAYNTSVRNHLSRLWWAIKMTYSKDHSDSYHYSKILFSNSQIFQDATQRKDLFIDRKILFAYLNFINGKSSVTKVADLTSQLMLNHLKSYNLKFHTQEEVEDLFNNFYLDYKSKGYI